MRGYGGGKKLGRIASNALTCPRKRAHLTLLEAAVVAARARVEHRGPWDRSLAPYRCYSCQLFHVGHSERARRAIDRTLLRVRLGMVVSLDELEFLGGQRWVELQLGALPVKLVTLRGGRLDRTAGVITACVPRRSV